MAKDTIETVAEVGACMCKKFAGGRFKSLHNWGQPGCKHEASEHSETPRHLTLALA